MSDRHVQFSPVILVQVVRANLEAFRKINKPRLSTNTRNGCFRITLGSIDADELLIIFSTFVFMDVPKQEYFFHFSHKLGRLVLYPADISRPYLPH